MAALTVFIETQTGTGSGFFFNMNAGKEDEVSDYVVITNEHVVEDHTNVKVCWAVTQRCVNGRVTGRSEDKDIAVIEHASFSQEMYALALISTRLEWGWGGSWEAGDVVYASGYPGGNKAWGRTVVSEPVVTEGIITSSRMRRYRAGYFIEHGADVAPGSSGGPLMNNDGYIVGMIRGSNTEAERLETAIPVGRVLDWLEYLNEPPPTPAPSFGSRGNPLPLNHTAFYPDWEISVISFNQNANRVIAAENRYNDPPEPGHVYVLARVKAKYTGSSIGAAWLDLDFYLIGDSNVFYEKAWVVTPDPLRDQPDALPGGTVVGNVEFMVPTNEVNSLLLVATDGGLRNADTIGYFSLR